MLLLIASLVALTASELLLRALPVAAVVHTVPVADHASFAPGELADIAGELGMPARPHDGFEEALAAIPAGARVLIFGSLYLAGAVLAANDQVPT